MEDSILFRSYFYHRASFEGQRVRFAFDNDSISLFNSIDIFVSKIPGWILLSLLNDYNITESWSVEIGRNSRGMEVFTTFIEVPNIFFHHDLRFIFVVSNFFSRTREYCQIIRFNVSRLESL